MGTNACVVYRQCDVRQYRRHMGQRCHGALQRARELQLCPPGGPEGGLVRLVPCTRKSQSCVHPALYWACLVEKRLVEYDQYYMHSNLAETAGCIGCSPPLGGVPHRVEHTAQRLLSKPSHMTTAEPSHWLIPGAGTVLEACTRLLSWTG